MPGHDPSQAPARTGVSGFTTRRTLLLPAFYVMPEVHVNRPQVGGKDFAANRAYESANERCYRKHDTALSGMQAKRDSKGSGVEGDF